MTRVVIDANFAGRGHFSRHRLDGLATKLAGTGTEFVVPEVVIWEWAEHAYSALTSLAARYDEFKVDPALLELPELPREPSVDELCEKIVNQLPSGFTVWRPTDNAYKRAVRAQVLQYGAGERKDGVKTGAADHLVFLCISDQLAERSATEAVIAASADLRLQALCQAELGEDALCASNDRELLSRLVEFVPAEVDLLEAVEAELHTRINTPDSDIDQALTRFSMGYELAGGSEEPSAWEEERFSLLRAEIVEVEELEVGTGLTAERRVASALIRIFGPVGIQLYEYERIGEEDFERVLTYDATVPGMIDVPLTILFERDWTIASVEPAGPATIHFNQ